MRRRELLTASLALASPFAHAASAAAPTGFRQLDLKLPGRIVRRVLVLIPKHLQPDDRVPLLILLHGYKQIRPERRAIHAWQKEFGVLESYERLRAPPVRPRHPTTGYLTAERQKSLRRALTRRPFKGLVLACPVTPNPYRTYPQGNPFDLFAAWLQETMLPEVARQAPILDTPESTGLAGVSMGGYVGIEVLYRRPWLFGAFTAIQSAIERGRQHRYADRIAEAFDQHGPVPLHVLTSSRDSYRAINRSFYRNLRERGIGASFDQPPGAHQNVWVEEVGSLETLFWQDRVLSRSGRRAGHPSGYPLHWMKG